MRYDRQISMPEIGVAGQALLKKSRVTVVGAGGLGSPVLTYLAAAGVGHITVIEHDTVEESNLNRQFLHTIADIGAPKAESARAKLLALNPETDIILHKEELTGHNALTLLRGADVVAACVDSVAARLVLNDACLALDIPLVDGGIDGFYGYVTVIGRQSACLRCLGVDSLHGNRAVAALGATAGVIGALQANECLKLLLRCGSPLYSKMLQYDGLAASFDVLTVLPDPSCGHHGAVSVPAAQN